MKTKLMFHSGLRWLSVSTIIMFGMLSIIASKGDGDDGTGPTTGTVSISSPSQGMDLSNMGTLTTSVFIDGDSTAAASSTIDTIASTVSIDVDISVGIHTFIMVFEYTDQVFDGPYQIAVSNSATLDVISGSTHSVSFSDVDYSYQDFDNDGFTNLSELHDSLRTDPSDSTCILDKTPILDRCTAG